MFALGEAFAIAGGLSVLFDTGQKYLVSEAILIGTGVILMIASRVLPRHDDKED